MKDWGIVIEGRECTPIAIAAVVIAALYVLLALLADRWADLPIHLGYVVCAFGAVVWPLLVMGRHRRQQDRILDKIRAHYVLALSALEAGEQRAARKRLNRIRSLERHWRLGASYPVRIALLSYVLVTNTALAFVGQVLAYHIGSHMNPKSLIDTVLLLWNTPWLLAIVALFAIYFSFGGFCDSMQIQCSPWAEFYGDRLNAAIKAGRGIEVAPQHDRPNLLDGVSARELLGLRPVFTNAELRRAWVRLARELHPDRWTRSGPGVQRMKEAGLKRVNAARDELMAQAA